jgi:hypothetical protein
MPSKRLTLYLTEESMETIGPAENLSGRVNSIICHYSRMTAEAAPALTQGEWFFLMDMLNGTFIEDNTGDHLWADISEAGRLDGLGEKWEVDAEAFAAKIRAMPHAARCAILDAVLRYWKGKGNSADEIHLTEAGAKIAAP